MEAPPTNILDTTYWKILYPIAASAVAYLFNFIRDSAKQKKTDLSVCKRICIEDIKNLILNVRSLWCRGTGNPEEIEQHFLNLSSTLEELKKYKHDLYVQLGVTEKFLNFKVLCTGRDEFCSNGKKLLSMHDKDAKDMSQSADELIKVIQKL